MKISILATYCNCNNFALSSYVNVTSSVISVKSIWFYFILRTAYVWLVHRVLKSTLLKDFSLYLECKNQFAKRNC